MAESDERPAPAGTANTTAQGDAVRPAPQTNKDATDDIALAEVSIDSKAPAAAKKWGLQPPEILRSMSAEERVALETKLRRKIDLRLLPMIIIMYILNYIDR
jgi:hypothetical protein